MPNPQAGSWYRGHNIGVIAQLGERLHGMQEVGGSIPPDSTILLQTRRFGRVFLRLIKVPLTDGQFDALVSFTFNLGSGAFQRSTLRRKVNREEHDEAPEQFMRWVWAGGRRLRGLVKRREAEIGLYT